MALACWLHMHTRKVLAVVAGSSSAHDSAVALAVLVALDASHDGVELAASDNEAALTFAASCDAAEVAAWTVSAPHLERVASAACPGLHTHIDDSSFVDACSLLHILVALAAFFASAAPLVVGRKRGPCTYFVDVGTGGLATIAGR